MREPLIVNVIQLQARRSKKDSLEAVKSLVRRSTGELIVLPEYAMFDPTGVDADTIYYESETLDGVWIGTLRDLAVELGSCIIGSLFERSPQPPRVYNTIVFIDKNGSIRRVYRKTHLFDALGYRESSFTLPGSEAPEPLDFCGLRLGYAICFEIRYPELFRLQALRGAEAFVVPSAWYMGHGKEESYRFLAQARAHENTAYLIGSVLFGERFTGRSLVVDPYGVVIAEAGFGERIVEAILDPAVLEEARRRLPLLELRRNDLYNIDYSGKQEKES